MKRESIYPCIISLILALIAIIAIYGYAKLDYENRKPTSSTSISETISITPTTMPTQEPTITPTTVTIDLTANYLALPKGSTGAFKSYEKITSITNMDSMQYKLKQFYRTDELGFCRFNDYYVVAIGQFYSQRIGECFRVAFEERSICVMVGDIKRIEDTVDGMYCKENGSIIEFIINPEVMSDHILNIGDVSSLGMQGKVVSIEREVIK